MRGERWTFNEDTPIIDRLPEQVRAGNTDALLSLAQAMAACIDEQIARRCRLR